MCDDGEIPASDAFGWRTTHSRRSDHGRVRHGSSSKRPFEGQGAEASSGRSRTGRSRPVARYRRSLVADGGTASGSAELSLGGSYETPISLLSPETETRAPAEAQNANEVINLDADEVDGEAQRNPPSLASSRRRISDLEEPSAKRVCNIAEDEVVALRRDEAPRALGSGRPGRSSVRRGGFSAWSRAGEQRIGELNPFEFAAAAVAEDEPIQPRQVNTDERLARRLQNELTAEGTDAQLARSLQEHENRRVFRVPASLGIDHARLQMVYMRHYERAERARNALGRNQQNASSSRQGEILLERSRALNSELGRRYRMHPGASSVEIEERLNVLGALLQGQVPLAMRLAYVDRDFNENDYEMLLALDDNVKQVGAPQSKIDELPITEVEVASDNDEPCTICLEKAEVGEKVRRLPCLHAFHQKCIDSWLQRRANCPVCKAEI